MSGGDDVDAGREPELLVDLGRPDRVGHRDRGPSGGPAAHAADRSPLAFPGSLHSEGGGSCGGVAYRLHAEHVMEEFKLLWRREMLAKAYMARWIDARTDSGIVKALTFVIDRNTPGYTGRLSDEDIIAAVVGAHGHYGSCADYLLDTAKSLEEHGISDQRMRRLARLLQARRHDP